MRLSALAALRRDREQVVCQFQYSLVLLHNKCQNRFPAGNVEKLEKVSAMFGLGVNGRSAISFFVAGGAPLL
jgi:hypothetical protein